MTFCCTKCNNRPVQLYGKESSWQQLRTTRSPPPNLRRNLQQRHRQPRPLRSRPQKLLQNQPQRPLRSQLQKPPQNQPQRPLRSRLQKPPQNQLQRPPQNRLQKPPQNQLQRPPQNRLPKRPLRSRLQNQLPKRPLRSRLQKLLQNPLPKKPLRSRLQKLLQNQLPKKPLRSLLQRPLQRNPRPRKRQWPSRRAQPPSCYIPANPAGFRTRGQHHVPARFFIPPHPSPRSIRKALPATNALSKMD